MAEKNNAKRRKMWWGAGAAVVLIIAAVVYWQMSATEVKVAKPTRGPAVEAVYATGVVEPVKFAEVASTQRGRIVERCRCEGKVVQKGDVLARLEDREQRALLAELEAREKFLHEEDARYKRLLARKVISEQAYQRIASEHEQVHAAFEAAKQRLEDYTLRAPMDGVVLREDGEVGEVVNAGEPFIWVGQPKPLWITADVDEEDIPQVAVGQRTMIKADAFPGQTLEGEVMRITPKGDPVNKSYRVRIGLPDDTPLLIGMTTEINIITRIEDDALLVPVRAVRGDRVFVVRDGRVKVMPVKIGISGTENLQVENGLSPDDLIVMDPGADLSDGDRVRPTGPEMKDNPGP